ncbi:MAG TPA: pyruvate kinase [Solirubrobacteraceae bacterium]|jgi:pyruvate kinase|nr:pyruvate kinase [Solirubrobacteraceae bacterium]
MRRTKIVATIGPACDDPETLARMVQAGMDVARLNFAHGTREEKARTAARVHTAADRAGRQVAILQDVPGPKLRIGPLEEDVVELKAGDNLTLVCGSEEPGNASRVPVPWAGLASAAASGEAGQELYLADGSVRLRIDAVREAECEIDVAVEVGGSIASRQGLNIPGELDELPAVPEEDLELIRFGESIGVDMVALSFVRRPEDVEQVRRHTRSPLIAKIEKPQAVDDVERIIRASDCVMVARGDLGIELRIEDVPMVQKRVLALAGALARPSITATQMLDAMVVSSRPTRAEVTDVANAILDGTDALMLSQETAVGAHPVGAVAMMASIAERTEREAPYEHWNEHRVRRITSIDDNPGDPAYTVAYNACAAARQLHLAALVVPTLSGRSARLVSAHRPEVPIYALSPGRETVRRCSLMWGVLAARMRRHEVTEELIADAVDRVVGLGWVERGSRIGVTAGLPSGRPGTTSLFQVQEA